MSREYEDIIHLPHHVSTNRNRMSMTDRAAQFSPFAALTGYDAAIRETGRLTDQPLELAADELERLDRALRWLMVLPEGESEVRVRYFRPDARKDGGAFVDCTGRVRRVDPHRQLLTLSDGSVIPFDRICRIDGDNLGE